MLDQPAQLGVKRTIPWRPILLLVVGLLAFARGWMTPMFFDDIHAIVENPTIRQLLPPWQALQPPRETSVAGRPLVNLSFALNYAIGGVHPLGYHLFSHGCHLLCALLLWGVLRRVFRAARLVRPDELALAAALLWVAHPLLSETVVYVMQRTELLMSLCCLLTIYAAFRMWEAQTPPGRKAAAEAWMAVSVLACFAGMASKEVMVSAPLLVLLCDRAIFSGTFREALSRHRGLYVGLAASWALLAYLNIPNPRSASAGFGFQYSPWVNLLTQSGVIGWYLRLCVIPWPLSVSYDWPVATSVSQVLGPALVLTAMFVAGAWAVVKNRVAGLSAVWFFFILAPTSSIIAIPIEVVAERRMYLPLAAVLAWLVVLFVKAGSRWFASSPKAGRVAGWTLVGAVVAGMVGLCNLRLNDYQDELTIWTSALALYPNDVQSLNGAAKILSDRGDLDQAQRLLEHALSVRSSELVLDNLGVVYFKRGEHEKALFLYQQAVTARPQMARAWNNMGTALTKLGRHEEAFHAFSRAVEVSPGLHQAQLNLGMSFASQSRFDEAIEHYRKAIGMSPSGKEEAVARVNLGLALLAKGRRDEARAEIVQALKLDPKYAAGQRALMRVDNTPPAP
ncbi:MAG: tetratricopeptide repeat protein [Phycisphaeraceae bacterium]|nr:tetratricopeptide repeat protein [Phycisphaeraceae bacterium]